jgi:hypothetical protein
MDKLNCPKCKKHYRKLHTIKKRGLKYYLCYKCYKQECIKDRNYLMKYHDNDLFINMMNFLYIQEGEKQ